MDNFNVYTNNQITNPPSSSKLRSFIFSPKIIFIILGIAVLVEVVFSARTLLFPTSSTLPLVGQFTPQAGTVGKISLVAAKTSLKLNEAVPVAVMIDTAGRTIDGVDLIVKYDPKILEITTADLRQGNILDEYPLMSVDSSKGLISISGISKSGNGFSGSGQFAVISLQAKAKGKTDLVVDFNPGSTADSNLVERSTSKNVLEQVDNLQLTIQ